MLAHQSKRRLGDRRNLPSGQKINIYSGLNKLMTDKMLQHLSALCNQVKRLAVKAGEATLEYYDESGSGEFENKGDGSPVTLADKAANEIIMEGLKEITPSVPIVSEEDAERVDISNSDYFWIVDPLDGTRGFIEGNPDYTVNIALIKNGKSILGVVYAPVLGELYAGHGPGTATRFLEATGVEKPIQVRLPKASGMTVVVSNFKGPTPKQDKLLEEFKVAKLIRRASSIKFCMVASGKADFYLCLKAINEWDTAAGEAVAWSAGAITSDMDGNGMRYGKADKNFSQPFFQVSSSSDLMISAAQLQPS